MSVSAAPSYDRTSRLGVLLTLRPSAGPRDLGTVKERTSVPWYSGTAPLESRNTAIRRKSGIKQSKDVEPLCSVHIPTNQKASWLGTIKAGILKLGSGFR